MFIYSQDAKAITLEAGEVIDNGTDLFADNPEAIVQIRVYDGWVYADFAQGTRRMRPEANIKLFREV